MKKLNNWYLTPIHQPEYVINDPWLAPELKKPIICMSGNVENHPDFKDGSPISITTLVKVWEENNELHVHTASGSHYVLGEPLDDYEKAYPNAKQRLLDMWNKA